MSMLMGHVALICGLMIHIFLQPALSCNTTEEKGRIQPTSLQAANISRAQVFYYQMASVGSGISLPDFPISNFTLQLSGTISITGVLAGDLEQETERIANGSRKGAKRFFMAERDELKTTAGELYFTFFQAAANFGFQNCSNNHRVLERRGYQNFSSSVGKMLETYPQKVYTANYESTVQGDWVGSGSLSVHVSISTLQLSSGKNITILKKKPNLVVAFENGLIFGDIEDNGEFEELVFSGYHL